MILVTIRAILYLLRQLYKPVGAGMYYLRLGYASHLEWDKNSD